MRIETKKVRIPAQTYIETVYYSDDGKKFQNQDACEIYENSLKIASHPVFKNSKDIWMYPYGYKAKAYYFSSEDDYNFFLKSQGLNEKEWYFESDYKRYGNGWYIFWEEEYENSHNEYSLKNLNNYMSEEKKDFEDWESSIFAVINN